MATTYAYVFTASIRNKVSFIWSLYAAGIRYPTGSSVSVSMPGYLSGGSTMGNGNGERMGALFLLASLDGGVLPTIWFVIYLLRSEKKTTFVIWKAEHCGLLSWQKHSVFSCLFLTTKETRLYLEDWGSGQS